MMMNYVPYIPKQIITIDFNISNTSDKINIKKIMKRGWIGWDTPLHANSIIFEDTSIVIYSCIKNLIIEFHKENIIVNCKFNIGSYTIYSISPYIYRLQIIELFEDGNIFRIKNLKIKKEINTIIIETIIFINKNNSIFYKNFYNICEKIKREVYSDCINYLKNYISLNLLYLIINYI